MRDKILNSDYTGDDLEELHDYAVTAINQVGESNVNFWFMNKSSEHGYDVPTYVMEELNYFNGANWEYIPHYSMSYFSSLIHSKLQIVILDSMIIMKLESHVILKTERMCIISLTSMA